jgi:hypothetical protein
MHLAADEDYKAHLDRRPRDASVTDALTGDPLGFEP